MVNGPGAGGEPQAGGRRGTHHDAPAAQPTPPAPVPQGCQTVPACTAEADDALSKNDIPHALASLNNACALGDFECHAPGDRHDAGESHPSGNCSGARCI